MSNAKIFVVYNKETTQLLRVMRNGCRVDATYKTIGREQKMMYVKITKLGSPTLELQAHKLQPLPHPDLLFDSDSKVTVQADGHELDKCLEMTGKLLPNRRVGHFFGDDAKFIVANWS